MASGTWQERLDRRRRKRELLSAMLSIAVNGGSMMAIRKMAKDGRISQKHERLMTVHLGLRMVGSILSLVPADLASKLASATPSEDMSGLGVCASGDICPPARDSRHGDE